MRHSVNINVGRHAARRSAVSKALAKVLGSDRPAHTCRVLRGPVVIDSLVAARKANGIRMMLLDILRNEADLLRTLVALVAEFDDLLTVVGPADVFDVFLKPLVRKERRGLRSGRGRAGQCARALGNVGQELRRLERIRLLLEELVVERRLPRLLRLLLQRAGANLCLSTLKRSGLCARTQITELRALLKHQLVICLLLGKIDALLLLGRAKGLCIALTVERIDGVGKCEALLTSEIRRSNTCSIPTKRTL